MPRHFIFLLLLLLNPLTASPGPVYQLNTEDFPPYNFADESGEVVGLCTEFISEIFRQAKLDYEHRLVPWKRAYLDALNTNNHGVYCTLRTQSREPLFHWVGPLFTERFNLYKRKSRKDIVIHSREDLNNYTFGINPLDGDLDLLLSIGVRRENIIEMLVPTVDRKLLLSNDRFDMFIFNDITLRLELSHRPVMKFEDFEVVMTLPTSFPMYLAMNKNTPEEVIEKLHASHRQLVASGHREKLMRELMAELQARAIAKSKPAQGQR
jgi:polar amino acid transport system substrate-binding protein